MNALYSLYDALVSIQVPAERARAVVDAMERDMGTLLATKADLAVTQQFFKRDLDSGLALLRKDMEAGVGSLRQELNAGLASIRQEMDLLRSSMTVRLGSMLVVGLSVLFAALKLT